MVNIQQLKQYQAQLSNAQKRLEELSKNPDVIAYQASQKNQKEAVVYLKSMAVNEYIYWCNFQSFFEKLLSEKQTAYDISVEMRARDLINRQIKYSSPEVVRQVKNMIVYQDGKQRTVDKVLKKERYRVNFAKNNQKKAHKI